MEIDSKIKRKIKAIQEGKIVSDPTNAVYELLDDAIDQVDKMEGIKKEIEGVVSKVEFDISQFKESLSVEIKEQVEEVRKEIGIKGDPGENYVLTESDKKEIAGKIEVPIIEKVIEKTEIIREQPIVTSEVKEVALPETPEQVRDKLETLKNEDRLDKSAIKGLEELEKNFNTQISSIPRGGGARGIQLYIGGAKKGIANYINLIAGSGVAITYSSAHGRNDITISASGVALSILAATGTINNSNKDFTFVSKPNVVIVNGASYQENKGWSWNSGTLTATLDNAVGTGGDIYGI